MADYNRRLQSAKENVPTTATGKGKQPARPAPPPAAASSKRPISSSQPAAAASAPSAAATAKRPRPTADANGVLVVNDDFELPEAEVSEWRRLVDELTRSGAKYVDEDFPAAQISIKGKEEGASAAAAAPAPAPPEPAPDLSNGPPKCRCGALAARATVSRDTPNKGRAYFHCGSRQCGFFCWADGGAVAFKRGGAAAKLDWARLPLELNIVSDFGFRAEDLRQGGVGDCWFMSALAVVAQRHDLVARLFAADTARNAPGCYRLRLFLDGKWTSVTLDDQLPVTASPRREALAFDTKLAFCRCGDASGAQQLWASLVEKAYAKAHAASVNMAVWVVPWLANAACLPPPTASEGLGPPSAPVRRERPADRMPPRGRGLPARGRPTSRHFRRRV